MISDLLTKNLCKGKYKMYRLAGVKIKKDQIRNSKNKA